MQAASKHFEVPVWEQEQWMLSFAHIVRDGLNQKRNACSQDLRKTIKSKCSELHYSFAKNLSNVLLSKQWYRESSSISGSVSSTPKYYQWPRWPWSILFIFRCLGSLRGWLRGMDSTWKGNQVDFRGKEGCICAGWSVYHLSIDELLGEVDWQRNGKMDWLKGW